MRRYPTRPRSAFLSKVPGTTTHGLLSAVLLAAAFTGCSRAAASGDLDVPPYAVVDSAAIVAEARAFVDAYVREHVAGDREALQRRVSRRGYIQLGHGQKTELSYAAVGEMLRAEWQPPVTLSITDATYEILSPDAVLVNGIHHWGTKAGVRPFAYSILLVREEGELRVRMEHESRALDAAPAPSLARPTAPPSGTPTSP